MKISKDTIQILQNFNTIHNCLKVNAGNVLCQSTIGKTIVVRAVVEEDFPVNFGIYDLSQFLGAASLDSEPEFNFEDNYVNIVSGNSSIRYRYASESSKNLIDAYDYVNKLGKAKFESFDFDLSKEVLDKVVKAASVLSFPDIVFRRNEDNRVVVSATDTKNSASNEIDVVLEKESEHPFNVVLKVEALKILPDSYNVSVASNACVFESKTRDLKYWIGVDKTSTFG